MGTICQCFGSYSQYRTRRCDGAILLQRFRFCKWNAGEKLDWPGILQILLLQTPAGLKHALVLAAFGHLFGRPGEEILENIRARGNINEINAVDEKYLKTMEDSYKDSLREYKRHSKILVYDWSTPGSTDVVVEDIEKMELDFYEWHSGDIFEEWNGVSDEWHWSQWRQRFTMKAKLFIDAFGRAQHHELGEMHHSPADQTHYIQVMKTQVLKSPYSHGYILEKDGQMNWHQNWLELYTHLPEPWYDYFYREYHYALLSSYIDNTDPWANSYNPDYIHSEHH